MDDRVLGIDGDDTLWHQEPAFNLTQRRLADLLAPFSEPTALRGRLLATERKNLELYGYGVKGFTLSMIETAIEVSGGRVDAGTVQAIIDLGREMLANPVELIAGASDALAQLAGRHRLVLLTKGDLIHQEAKLARSGVGDHFWRMEVVAEKDTAAYARVMRSHGIDPARFVMIGNSLRSDVLPALRAGARAVHVPYPVTWELEHAVVGPEWDGRWATAPTLADVPAALATLS